MIVLARVVRKDGTELAVSGRIETNAEQPTWIRPDYNRLTRTLDLWLSFDGTEWDVVGSVTGETQ